jgi:uncharacterized membrane protein
MPRNQHNNLKQRRASQAAMLIAAASVPNTFQRTLMRRKTSDQGAITGATMAINYLIVSTIRKLVEDTADNVAGTKNARNKDWRAHRRQRQFSAVLDASLLGLGLWSRHKIKQKDQESTNRAVLRTANTWVSYSALAGLSISVLDEIAGATNKKSDKLPARYKAPWGIIGGTIFAGYTEYRRRRSLRLETGEQEASIKTARAVAMGASVLASLAAIEAAESYFARVVSRQANKLLPGSEDFFWSVGHTAALAGTALGTRSAIRHVYRQMEEVATDIEPAYLEAPVSDLKSGSPGSLVDWQSLSVQGRRFVSTGAPAEDISMLMDDEALEPIRVYAGLDSAPTETQRLGLVLRELERTKAYERSLIMLVSPTGTGYVNYVAVEAAEIMSRGNIATAALQYSKRPSPMSLDRVPEGRLQFRMLAKAVSERIAKLPARRRPKLIIFGESLGAWTSQDAFIDQGTDGLEFYGVERALWIGTPYGSKWKNQVLGSARPDVDPSLIGKFDNINELLAVPAADRRKLKYFMLTHHNDPVALFNLGLIIREPDWLKDPSKRPPTVSHSQYYTTPGTFLLTLIDMGNAMNIVPGKFEATGHDYRADLPEFVRQAYGFDVDDTQMAKVNQALRNNELERAERLNRNKRQPEFEVKT